MSGPIRSDKNKQSSGFDWMESVIIFAGVLVVLGLLMESRPELKLAWNEGRFPKLPVTGGIIVTIGVLTEVILGIFITQRANRVQSEANERISIAERATAEARERTANLQIEIADARERQAEAEELLGELRRAQSARAATFNFRKFVGLLGLMAKSTVSIFFQPWDEEAREFSELIHNSFVVSGKCNVAAPSALPIRVDGYPPLNVVGAAAQGVTVIGHRGEPLSITSPYKVLTDAFLELEVKLSGRFNSDVPEGDVWIVVGPKP